MQLFDATRQFVRQHFGRINKNLGAVPGGPKPKALSTYQTTPLPPAPVKWQPFRRLHWGEYGNAGYGDCVYAAAAHCWMALSRLLHQKFAVTGKMAIDAYKVYMAKYDNGQDAGAVPSVVLQDWHTQGMWGANLPAWAPIDHTNLDEVRQTIHSYGCLMVCVQLPKPAWTYQLGSNYIRFKRPIWRLTGTADDNVIVGYHEVAAVGYDKQFIYCISWGMLVRVTHSWWNRYVTETSALVVPAVVTAGGFNGLDFSSLEADLATLPATH